MVSVPFPTHGAHSATAAEQPRPTPPLPVKLVIAGGFGVGKTTTVGSISEIRPLTTEAAITEVAAGVDDLTHTPDKTTTTVAMDFGCITIDPTLKLYLFGTPGQDRFGFMWDDIVDGALGALVIVDTRRLDDCYAAVDYFEHRGIPFAVAVNAFDGEIEHGLDEVRWALDIAEHVPLTVFDARRTGSVRDALLVVLDVALSRAESAAAR
ncbi:MULTISPECIES: ATP/GTP-binding protein [unclassified Streptomyces]|uniref:GTP-binding protein n=1 Tax=unclassified Streptomyces TaxID=2593676 RepID=UPI001E397D95|nr:MULTISPECIES: ATP/GTP-binding protein [unclassified Streptomyces]MCC9711412.1 ATP/GTP-binding protein [Streptomyces sp. MNU76]WNZ06574.1 ATP/GTP-binding protein [Streptomyces sp. 11x1]